MPFDAILGLIVLIPVLYVSHFLHELGHVLLGRWNGHVVTSFGMGLGRPFWAASWRGTRVYLSFKRPLQGVTFWFADRIYPTLWQKVWSLAGGVLAQCILAIAAIAMLALLSWGSTIWLIIFL